MIDKKCIARRQRVNKKKGKKDSDSNKEKKGKERVINKGWVAEKERE